MPEETYDVAVLGAGTGGYSAALRAAQLGKRVALIERDDRLGGTCLLRGCIPTKALLQTGAVMDAINRSETWGIQASGQPDWPAVQAFKAKVVDKLVSGVTGLVKARKIDVIQGTARLVAGKTALDVDGRIVEATDVVLASGSYARLLPGMSIGDRVITSDQALSLDYVPSSAVVIGAGAVGLEFASFYRSMGAEVTLIEALPRLAPLEDEEISKEVDRAYRKRGIKSFADAKVQDVQETESAVRVTYEAKGQTEMVTADICLVAVGRGPISDGLGYEEAGVELDRGYVKVDGKLQTTVPHVWAIGDLAATPYQLAHVSFAEGISVAERIAELDPPEIDYTGVCRVTYCSPEIASVGLTETQALERGYELDVEKLHMQGIGKANILGEGGLVKVLAESGGGPVLGIHMIGPHVTDLIAEGMLIVNWEAVPAEVAALIHPHPSLSEAIGEAHLALAGKSLHTP